MQPQHQNMIQHTAKTKNKHMTTPNSTNSKQDLL